MVMNTGEDKPLEPQQHQKAPDPSTERRNNNLPLRGVMPEVRPDEERIHGLMKESTVWDVYNNEARKVDNELVKDWTASLNLLLVFVSSVLSIRIHVLTLTGGYLCGRPHRIYHREQEYAGARQ
jgi:hypothetical protein